jgi:RNA polymerase sigma-70 factor (ECF subfamily)
MRDAGREVSLHRGAMPQATSVSLAAQLLGRFTSVTQAVQRAEMQLILQEAINGLDPIDREILALRHFEELSNDETAQVLEIKPSAASNRHIRATNSAAAARQGSSTVTAAVDGNNPPTAPLTVAFSPL